MKAFVLAASSALFFCVPARADIVYVSIYGEITYGIDQTGHYSGIPNGSLTGNPFSLFYSYDTSSSSGASNYGFSSIPEIFSFSSFGTNLPSSESMNCIGYMSCITSSFSFTPTSGSLNLSFGRAGGSSFAWDSLGGTFGVSDQGTLGGAGGTFAITSISDRVVSTPIASSLTMIFGVLGMFAAFSKSRGLTALWRRR